MVIHIVAGLAALSLVLPSGTVPTTPLLETVLIALVLINTRTIPNRTAWLLFLLTSFVVIKSSIAILGGVAVIDLITAYKAFVYLTFFAVLAGKASISRNRLEVLLKFLIVAMLTKYSLMTFTGAVRPSLWTEANFEVMFPLLLLVGLYDQMGPGKDKWLVAMGFVMLLSQSRSGIVAYAMTTLIVLVRIHRPARLLLVVVASIPLIAGVFYVFRSRAQSAGFNLSSIDRYQFFLVFLDETRGWSLSTWAFGTTPLTPLTSSGCYRLSFYENLFSSTGDGTCYSVIYHAFILRLIFDHGFIGFVACFAALYFYLRTSHRSRRVVAAIIVALVANGMSVSSLNSIYVALPIALLLVTSGPRGEDLRQGLGGQSHPGTPANRHRLVRS